MRSIVSGGYGRRPLPAFRYPGSINAAGRAHGITASISVKNTSRRVCLRLPANSASEKLSWLMEHGSLSDGTGLGITLHQLTNKENLIRVSLARKLRTATSIAFVSLSKFISQTCSYNIFLDRTFPC